MGIGSVLPPNHLRGHSATLRLSALRQSHCGGASVKSGCGVCENCVRFYANVVMDQRGHEDVAASDACLDQWRSCWLRCESCKKLRLVSKESLRSLQTGAFNMRSGVQDGSVDWRRWLEEAPDRYAVLVAKHAMSSNVCGMDDVECLAPSQSVSGLRHTSLMADRVDQVSSLPEAHQHADVEGSDTVTVGSSEVASEDEAVRAELSRFVYAQHRSVDADRTAAAALYANVLDDEQAVLDVAPVRCSGSDAETSNVRFECRMLQRTSSRGFASSSAKRRWVTMSCGDDDDCLSLRRLDFEAGTAVFDVGDEIMLLDARPWVEVNPLLAQWYQLRGRVMQVLTHGRLVLQLEHSLLAGKFVVLQPESHPAPALLACSRQCFRPSLADAFSMGVLSIVLLWFEHGCKSRFRVLARSSSAKLVGREWERNLVHVRGLLPRSLLPILRAQIFNRAVSNRGQGARLTAAGRAHCDVLVAGGESDEARLLRALVDEEDRCGRKLFARASDARRILDLIEVPVLLDEVLVLPLKLIPLRVAKYDVCLREQPLRAVHAMHTILTSMVMFRCWCCNERFPTFHPALEPPHEIELELRRGGRHGLASCDVGVSAWDELPGLYGLGEQPTVAESFTGTCRRCQCDMDAQAKFRGVEKTDDDAEAEVIPRRSFRNSMDPCWTFPHEELGMLFKYATSIESMLVALEHMQVNWVTVFKRHLNRFKKNVISFPQDSPGFFARWGALRQFRIGDRVNSARGPGKDVDRPVLYARDVPVS